MTEVVLDVPASKPTSSPSAGNATDLVVTVSGTANQTENSVAAKATAKAGLLASARSAIDRCDAGEALGCARDDHGATHREMAKAVGMSIWWVNRLLKWRDAGCDEVSPFGPTTRVGRVQHAEQRSRKLALGATAPEYRTKTDCEGPCLTQPAASADANSLRAVDAAMHCIEGEGRIQVRNHHWWPRLDEQGQIEIISYFNKTSSGAP